MLLRNSITILSWNIQNLAEPWDIRKQLLIEAIHACDPDIIAMQEVRHQFRDRLDQAGEFSAHLKGYHYVVEPASITEGYWEGLATFSRHPILRYNFFGLSRDLSDPFDAPHQRIVLATRIAIGDGRSIDVFNTHWSLSERARRRTSKETIAFIRFFSGSGGGERPRFLVGDLNAEPTEPCIADVVEDRGRLKDAWREGRPDEPGYTWQVPSPSVRTDYIFFAGRAELESCKLVGSSATDQGIFPSDHHGLVATFDVDP